MGSLKTYIVKLLVEAARVADRLSARVPPPQRRGRRLAVGAARPLPAGRRLEEKKLIV